MNDQERYKMLEATVKLLEKQGRPVSGRELLNFYAATTDSTIKLQQLNWNLKKLEKEGFVTAKFVEDNGVVSDVQNIEVTEKVINNFENEKTIFLNKIWALIPQPVKLGIYLILLVGSISAGVKYLPELFATKKATSNAVFEDNSIDQKLDTSTNVKSEGQIGGFTAGTMYFGQDQTTPETTLFIAQQVWIETKNNLSELQKMLDDPTEGMPKAQGVRFAHDAYDKYGERLSRSAAAQQMINFYEQLKRLERGAVYTHVMISETIGQGKNVTSSLEKDFGIRDYFAEVKNPEQHVASADTVGVR